MNKPFKISVHSDALEYADTTTASEGTLANNRGFSISESLRYFAAEAASLNCNFFFQVITRKPLVSRDQMHNQIIATCYLLLVDSNAISFNF